MRHLSATALVLFAGITAALPGAASATTDLPAQIRVDSTALQRVGQQTIRYLGLFRVYTLGVYAPRAAPPSELLRTPASTCIEAHYHRDIDREVLIKATNHILQRQHPSPVLNEYAERLDQVHGAYVDIRTGDRYRLCHLPGQGLRLTHNDGPALTLPDEDFARLYLGIWLGPGGILDDHSD